MDRSEVQRTLQTLITYFETGIKETDAAAKAILDSESEYWQGPVERYRNSPDWTGIRSPEAELLALALQEAKDFLEDRGG